MTKNAFLLSVLLLACGPHALAEQATRPNVLFLAVDDMNDFIGCLESTPQAITPNFNRLAERGVLFTNAHTAGVFCAPSRAAIFSGQYASTTGCYQSATYFVDHPEIESLQTSFAKAGYNTFGAGKLFHHPAGAIDTRDWTEFFLRSPGQRTRGWPLDSWSEGTPFPSPFPNSVYNAGQEITGGLFLEWAALPNESESDMADTIRIDWAVQKLQEQHTEPFFLGVGIYAPHYPHYCPQKYFDLYDPEQIELPKLKADDLDDLPPKIQKMKTARSRILKKLQGLEAHEDAIHGYLACISYADAMMGRVLDALEASPHADNTIIVLWSDHGYHFGEKGDWGKHTLWERTSNVPFIWAGPGLAENIQIDTTVSLIDMYPTLVELCDLPQPQQNLEGESLAGVLQDPSTANDRNVFLPHMHPGEYAVINQNWRYIRYGEDGQELYDLQADPHEWHNLAFSFERQGIVDVMQASAPEEFAPPAAKFNTRRDLRVDGNRFTWEKGQGNAEQLPKYLPYTERPTPEAETDTPTEPQAKQTRNSRWKNVLLIVCDDLNTHVAPSGYAPIHTPTLASFASESITFSRAFCQYPVCGPSRASFLSGLYPQSTGILNNTDDIRHERPGTMTMPQFFKEQGFWTASVGKIFHSPRHEHGDTAWDAFLRFDNDELPVVRVAREEFEAEFGSVEQGPNRRKWRALQKQVAAGLAAQTPPGLGASGLTDEQHKDGKNARQVAQWLRAETHGEQPFFIACGFQKPHVPFLAPQSYFDLYPQDEIVYDADPSDLWTTLPKTAISKRFEAFGFELGQENDALRRKYMQAYHACVSFVDAQLKIVLDALEESGHSEDTIVIFTSDHGYHLGDHFLWGKVTLFDIGAKVPLVIRAPGLSEPNSQSQAMVELIDLFPTLADLMGLEAPPHLQGASLRPLLGHPERLGRKKHAYSVVTRGQQLGYALRNQRWRYGKWPDGEELYNLTNDPDEKHNLAMLPHLTERLEEFRSLLAEKEQAAQAQAMSAAAQ